MAYASEWLKNALDLLAPGWVGSIIGLLGIAAAVVTYFLTRQRGALAYKYAGERLLGLASDGLPAGITVQYQGQEIPRLSRSLFVLWNAGEKTVLSEDIVASDPLRLMIGDDGKVLAATVLKHGREVSQVTASLDATKLKEVILGFAFLDAGDGAVVEVLHTSEKRHLDVLGTIRGLPRGIRDRGQIEGTRHFRRSMPFPRSPRQLGWFATAIGAVVAFVGLLVPWEILIKLETSSLRGGLLLAGAGAMYALLGVGIIFLTRRRYPKSLHLDGLD